MMTPSELTQSFSYYSNIKYWLVGFFNHLYSFLFSLSFLLFLVFLFFNKVSHFSNFIITFEIT